MTEVLLGGFRCILLMALLFSNQLSFTTQDDSSDINSLWEVP